MECDGYTVAPEVPTELSTTATCTTAFFRVASALHQLEGQEAVQKHTLFTTRCGRLVEAVGDCVERSTHAPKDVTKIVVHHDFGPMLVYVVLVCRSGKAVLLTYADFKVVHEWEEVMDVTSADPSVTGSPQLFVTKENGRPLVVPNTKLMSYTRGDDREEEEEEEAEEEQRGKKDAVQALMHRFKGGLRHADQLRNERKTKENFIARELETLQSWLKGRMDTREESLVAAVAIGNVQGSAPKPSPGPLRVVRIFHHVVHNKWVIMVNVTNASERMLVGRLELTLCCDDEPLQHTSQVLKSVKHSSLRQPGEARVTIDHLDPLVLRPKKRASVVAVCDVPSFKSGPSVTCSGLLSYMSKPVTPASTPTGGNGPQGQEYQVSIPSVSLAAHELPRHMYSWEHRSTAQTEGVSSGAMTLVAASCRSHVSLTSIISPLTGFLDKISQHHKVIKVANVSDFHVLYPSESHPLQLCGFILHPVDAHSLTLDLFARDEKQTMLLAHSLLAALPKDTRLEFLQTPKDTESPSSQPEPLQHMLLAKIRETASFVVDGLEAQLSNKAAKTQRKEGAQRQEDSAAEYARERQELLARKGDIVFKGEEYRAWRKDLQGIQSEVDGLYLKYLKMNCG